MVLPLKQSVTLANAPLAAIWMAGKCSKNSLRDPFGYLYHRGTTAEKLLELWICGDARILSDEAVAWYGSFFLPRTCAFFFKATINSEFGSIGGWTTPTLLFAFSTYAGKWRRALPTCPFVGWVGSFGFPIKVTSSFRLGFFLPRIEREDYMGKLLWGCIATSKWE